MHKIYEIACDEIEELEKKANEKGLSASDLEYANKLAELKKNILKISMMEDEGYSADDDMSMNNSMMRNNSRGYRDSSNRSYARGRGRNARRDSMGRYSREYSRYSRDDGYSASADELIEQLEDMKESAPDEMTRKEITKLIDKMSNV